jgi:putative oxidoreductase
MGIFRLLARLVVGGLFIGHATQKLFGWFEGPGLRDAAEGFESMGLRPGREHALAASAAEAGGGALLAAGLATPAAAALLSGTMITAIERAHLERGLWNTKGGYEYNLVLIAAALALAETGPGSPSIDSARGRESHGIGTAALALGLGVAGAAGAQLISGFFPEPPAEPEAPTAESSEPADSAAG